MYPEKIEISTTVTAAAGTTVNIDNLQAAQTINNIITPALPASALPTVWNAPLKNPRYFERAHTKDIKDRMKLPNEGAHLVSLVAMSGLGGVGKTELAKNYFYYPEKNYTAKLWFTANSREHLESEYRLLAQELKLIEKDDSAELIKQKIHGFFAQHPGWLIIFDNADNPSAIQDLLPREGGDILITSRNPNWQGEIIEVDVLSIEDAFAFYQKLTGKKDEYIRPLVEALGYLPLAIAQAAAYVSQIKRVDTQQYLERFNKYRAEILSKNNLPARNKAETDRLTILTTWNLSLEAIQSEFYEQHEEGTLCYPRELLIACAYLAGKNIPITFFEKWANYIDQNESVELLVDDALKQMSNHSLVQSDQHFVHMHRLVQEVIRIQNPLTQSRRLALAVGLYEEGDEKDSSMQELKRTQDLIPHCESLIVHWTKILEQPAATQEEDIEREILLAGVFDQLGRLYSHQGLFHLAKPLFIKELDLYEKHNGSTLGAFISALRNLGHIYVNLRQASDAIQVLERALAIQTTTDANNVEIAGILGELGLGYGLLNQFEKACDLLQRAVTIQEAHYGPNHIKLVRNLRNLGSLKNHLDPLAANELLERALAIQKAHDQHDHVNIVPTLLSLSDTGMHALNIFENNALVAQAYQIAKQYYGPKHPDTAIAAAKLATTCAILQDWVEPRDVLLRESYINVCNFPGYGKDHDYAKRIIQLAIRSYMSSARFQLRAARFQRLVKQDKKAALDILLEGAAWLADNTAFIGTSTETLENVEAYEEIVIFLQTALNTAQDKFLLTILLAKAHVHLKNDEQALKAYYQAWLLDKTAFPFLIDEALFVFASSIEDPSLKATYAKCFQLYGPLLNRVSVNGVVAVIKASPTHQQFNLLEKTINDWTTLERRDDIVKLMLQFPEHPIFLIQLAEHFSQKQDVKLAAYYYQQFVDKAPAVEKPRAYHNLACCYFVLQKLELADTYFKKGINDKPSSAIYAEYGHFLYQKGKIADAIPLLQKALELSEDEEGLCYSKMERTVVNTTLQQAIDQWGTISLSSQYFAYYLLAKCHQVTPGSQDDMEVCAMGLKDGVSESESGPIYAFLLADINKNSQPSSTQVTDVPNWNNTPTPAQNHSLTSGAVKFFANQFKK